jgi:hypothetical protein
LLQTWFKLVTIRGRVSREVKQVPSEKGRPSWRPIYGPVLLQRLDPAGVQEMKLLISRGAHFSWEILQYEHGLPISRLAEAIGERIVGGEAARGLEIDDLCQGRFGAGHIREGFGESMGDFIDLSVRAILALSDRNTIYGHITSLPMRVGRDSNALGIDRNPGVGPIAIAMFGALGSSDRLLPHRSRWLLTGTHDDHSSPRADPERIARFTGELGFTLPGPLWEHLARQFAAEDRVENLVVEAINNGHSAFDLYWIAPEKFGRYGFPKCVIVDSIASGAPTKKGGDRARDLYPGDMEDVVETLLSARRYGIVRCELPQPKVPREQVEDELLPALEEQYREAPRSLPSDVLEDVARWKRANELQVGENIHLVRYFWFERANVLLRSIQLTGAEEGEILGVDLWRIVSLRERNLRAAVALTERAQQDLARHCLTRYRYETEIGRMKAWKAPYREGLLSASLLPNAAGVSAHRRMEWRHQAAS